MPATSVAQRRLMAIALKIKKGEIKYKDASPAAQKLSRTMSTKQLEDFAKTKEKGLPMKKTESVKEERSNEILMGGMADNKTLEDIARKHDVDIKDIQTQFNMGLDVEKEHTDDPNVAEEIVKDHLWEMPDYYTKLKDMENESAEGMSSPSNTNGMSMVTLPNVQNQTPGSGDVPYPYGAKKKEDEEDEDKDTKESFNSRKFKFLRSYNDFKSKI